MVDASSASCLIAFLTVVVALSLIDQMQHDFPGGMMRIRSRKGRPRETIYTD